jgi:hypothetical protein
MEKLKTEIRKVNFHSIQEADINPQQMKEDDFRRLVKSIKKDGVLTSSVLLQDLGNEKYKCISGHHRIKAAIKAGLKESECLILKDINESTRIRLQLQHNDIHGEPDESLVQELRKSLMEEDLKLVADGINEIFKDQKIEYEEPLYSYVHICLMPESEKEFTQLLDNLSTEETKKYIFEKPEYELLKKCFTFAFHNGYKTPGKAIRRILDIYLQNEEANGGKT